MTKEELLNEELLWYDIRGNKLKPTNYNRNEIFNLFRKYKNYGVTVNEYCCYGETRCCWQELIEEGNWGATLVDVRNNILSIFRGLKHILRTKKDGYRMYMFKDNKVCYIYIYSRDTIIKADYHIWFSNNID